MANWYIKTEKGLVGPFVGNQLKQLAASGKLDASSVIQKERDGKPTKAKSVKGLFDSLDKIPPTPPPLALPSKQKSQPKNRIGFIGLFAYPALAIASLALVATVGSFCWRWYQTETAHSLISSANESWLAGEKDVAIADYQKSFSLVPAKQLPSSVVERVLNYQVENGQAREAEETLAKLVDSGGEFQFDSLGTQQMLSAAVESVAKSESKSSSDDEEKLDGLPTSFTQLDNSWSMPFPKLQALALWHRMPDVDYRDKLPTRPFAHENFIVFEEDGQYDNIRLWDKATNQEIVSDSDECDYFTRTAAFSKSGEYMACVDGELVRVWRIENAKASLMSSVPASSPLAWNKIRWVGDSKLILEVIQSSKVIFRLTQIDVDEGKAQSAQNLLDNVRLRDFQANVSEFSPENNQTYLLTYAYQKEGKLVPAGINLLREDGTKSDRGISLPNSEDGSLSKCFVSTCSPYDNFGTFFPFGDYKRIAFLSSGQKQQTLLVYDVESRKELARLPLGSSKVNSNERSQAPTFVEASANGRFIVQHELNTFKTSRSKETKSTLKIWDLAKSKSTFEKTFNGKLVAVRFVDNGASLFGVALSKDSWRTFRFNTSSGEVEHNCVGSGDLSSSIVSISPDGDYFVMNNRIWDRRGHEEVDALIAEGNKLFESGQWKEARRYFATVLLDPMANNMWWRAEEFKAIWSRCFDCYVAEKNNSDAKALLSYCDANSIVIQPASDDGSELFANIRDEQKAEAARMASEQQKKSDEAFAKLRSENKAKHIPADKLTRNEFVEVMRDTMSRGSLSSGSVNAVFDNYSFQDRIGSPSRDLSYVDSKRLYYYKCSDGVVILTTRTIRGSVYVSEIDLY